MSFHDVAVLAVHSRSLPRAGGGLRLQRKCACGRHTGGAECAGCRGKGLGRQPSRDAHGAELEAPAVVHGVLQKPGSPLDQKSRSFMEPRFGHDFGRIRVHTNAAAAASADAIQARAYAIGDDLVFGPREYTPHTREGRRLLAHELTHAVQQTAARGPHASQAEAEAEAEENSRHVAAGHASQTASAVIAGALQRQGKPKTTLSGERTGTKEGKDKFGFTAEVKVPLTPDLTKKFKFGEVAFLDDLKLTGGGSVTGEALGLSVAELEDLKLQVALTLARLELAKAKKAEALRKGQLSLGATLSATDGATFSFDPFDAKRSLGASLTTKVSATTPSLLPSGKGELTLGSSITGAGSVTQEVGGEEKTTPKAEAKVGSEATFKSAPSSALGLGGVLGKEGSITAGVETGASLAVTPEKTSGKLTAGGSLGLTGKAGGSERFIKIQVTGTIGLDQEKGNAAVSTRSVFIGASTGFKF